ncbi:hypothetical protein VNI00_000149 [Paramarasmius palmivorus]|uniref:Uncharacterized protein n=1 Tax=Paramarasmius palmivorus TaxID=297713 RepID=A0AAW0EG96_9AGAR
MSSSSEDASDGAACVPKEASQSPNVGNDANGVGEQETPDVSSSPDYPPSVPSQLTPAKADPGISHSSTFLVAFPRPTVFSVIPVPASAEYDTAGESTAGESTAGAVLDGIINGSFRVRLGSAITEVKAQGKLPGNGVVSKECEHGNGAHETPMIIVLCLIGVLALVHVSNNICQIIQVKLTRRAVNLFARLNPNRPAFLCKDQFILYTLIILVRHIMQYQRFFMHPPKEFDDSGQQSDIINCCT